MLEVLEQKNFSGIIKEAIIEASYPWGEFLKNLATNAAHLIPEKFRDQFFINVEFF